MSPERILWSRAVYFLFGKELDRVMNRCSAGELSIEATRAELDELLRRQPVKTAAIFNAHYKRLGRLWRHAKRTGRSEEYLRSRSSQQLR